MGVDATSLGGHTPTRQPPAREVRTNREAEDPLIGQLLDGRYKLERLLARGAMGAVYVAKQTAFDRRVAVKILDPRGASESVEVFEERFLREAATLARLQHPNTVRVIDYGHHGNDTYLVMEFVDGHSMRRLQAGGPVPAQRVLHIAMQICDALQEAHALGLMHRDLKPANVLLTRHAGALDVVKVVDFGLAKDYYGNSELTQAGQVLGTPMYMAPEQIRDETCDHRIDIYALGVLMYRALTGVTPIAKGPAMQVLMAHLKELPPSFAVAAPEVHVPPAVEWVVQRCLEKRPDDRFANVVELKKALSAAKLAIENPALYGMTLGLHQGHTVLPDELCEASSSTVSVKMPTADDALIELEADVPFMEGLPARTMWMLLTLVGWAGMLAGASLERWLNP